MTTATILEFQPRPIPAAESAPANQHLLHVTFESTDGERRTAFGGGETVAAAVAAARDELPLGGDWTVARWAPLYGE